MVLCVWLACASAASAASGDEALGRLVWKPLLEPLDTPGLERLTVGAIAVDTSGFLWLGSASGLARLDGQRTRLFEGTPDAPRLFVGGVRRLLVDSRGMLWIGADRGLARFDLGDESFTLYRHQPDGAGLPVGEVSAFAETPGGSLWVGSVKGGLARLDPDAGTWHPPRAEVPFAGTNTIRTMRRGPDGRVYVAAEKSLLVLDEDALVAVHPLEPPAQAALSIVHDADGQLWVGTIGGLARLDSDTGTVRLVRADPRNTGQHAPAFHLAAGADGTLWIAWGDYGPVHFDPSTETARTIAQQGELPAIFVHRDPSGIVRFQNAFDTSLHSYDPRRQSYRLFELELASEGAAVELFSLCGEFGARFWLATSNGLVEVDGESRRIVRHHAGDLPSGGPVFRCSLDREGTLWVGTVGGLFRRRAGEDRFELLPYPPYADASRQARPSGVTATIHHADDGTLWITAQGDSYRHDPRTDRLVRQAWSDDEPAVARGGPLTTLNVFDDRAGRVWLAPLIGGLFVVDAVDEPVRFHQYHPDEAEVAESPPITGFAESADGSLWLGTMGSGLRQLDASRRFVAGYGQQDGVGDYIDAIEIVDGVLWVWSEQGLVRFDPSTGEARRLPTGRGGVVSQFSRSARLADGRLVMVHVDEMAVVDPREVEAELARVEPPAITLAGLRLFNQPVAVDTDGAADALLSSPLHLASHLALGHGDDVVTIELASLDFHRPDAQRFSYRLRGFDDDWLIAPAGQPVATYTDLDPGEYVFEARARRAEGPWSEPVALAVSVAPPPWRTWWAYAAYVLGFVGLVAFAWRGQRRKLERERRVNRQLRTLDRLKDDFLANTSHELRTPLHGISGLAESALTGRHGTLPETLRSDLDLIVSSSRRLSSLVNDILDFSKIRHRGIELHRRRVDLHSLADIVLTLCRPLAAMKNLSLENRIPTDLPPVVADQDRLQQILHNLVGNAIKFTDSGVVEVGARDGEGVVEMWVRDTGPGIPPALQSRIFRAFEQGGSSDEREHGGTGLGLAVSRQLVERHGGQIRVDSQPGQGSTFTFTIPYGASDQDAGGGDVVSVLDDPGLDGSVLEDSSAAGVEAPRPRDAALALVGARAAAPSPGADEPAPPDSGRILVVDDDPVNRRVLVGYLYGLGYEVLQASDGPDALQRLEADASAIDLVLLDIMMPKMSGYEVCRAIRERWSIDELPVLFLTAKSQVEDRVAGFAEGGNDYLIKPVARNELVARVAKELQLLELHRRLEREVESLSGLLPICSSCKSVRDDDGYWNQIESFIAARSEAQFTHGICPDCARRLYGGAYDRALGRDAPAS